MKYRAPTENDSILDEIKANYDLAVAYWEPIRREGDKDIRYATKGPWDEAEIQARKGRPTLALDELGQYLNQLENQARQNKRAVKVSPEGDGADDETARIRGGIIRGVEYKCKAQQAYIGAFGDAVRRSYGYFKLTTDFEPGTFNRVLKVVGVPNPNVILLDPDFKEADASDCGWSFEIEKMTEKQFAKRWPKAEVRSFTPEHVSQAPSWIAIGEKNKYVQVASYCRLEQAKKKLIQLEDGSALDMATVPGLEIVKVNGKDMVQLPDGRVLIVLDKRDDNDPKVVQYVTNGIEILEKTPLDFKEVPIIPVFGREEWVSEGTVSKREFYSLVRMVRDAYKGMCYAASALMERLGMDPKTPYEGWVGQFNNTSTNFETLASEPRGFVEFDIIHDENGQAILDKPTKNFTEPAIGQYLAAVDMFRRAVQAAMGGSPLPTAAQRQNEKSGIALQKIEQATDEGNYHFIDNFDRALERAGRMMNDALDVTYSPNGLGGRQVPFNDEAGEGKPLTINKFNPVTGEKEGFHVGSGSHNVTITTGPSQQSERDAADDFLDKLAQNQVVFPRIADLVVKLKNLGPIGDQIAQRLTPPGANVDPALQAQMQASQQEIAKLQQELQSAKAGDQIKKYTVDEQEKTKRVLGLLKVDQQDAETELDKMLGVLSDHSQRFHEVSQKITDHQQSMERAQQEQQHAKDMADQQAEIQAEQQQAAPAE